MKVQALRCPSCLDVVWSRHRHDWRTCSCYDIDLDRGCFIDGGRDYLRYGWMGHKPEIFELEVADPTPPKGNPMEPDEEE